MTTQFGTRWITVILLLGLCALCFTQAPSTRAYWSQMTEWTMQSPRTLRNTLYRVWGSGPNDVFAVGEYGTIVHYDGAGWEIVDRHLETYFRDVWGSGPDDVFVVGGSGITLHYDGNDWRTMDSGTDQALKSLWGSGSSDVFAVGYDYGYNYDLWRTVYTSTILHYDGSVWATMHSATDEFLIDVWGNGPGDIFAVGGSQKYDRHKVLHYDGSDWTTIHRGDSGSLPDIWWQGSYLTGVWGSGSEDVFAIEFAYADHDMGAGAIMTSTILHYDGSIWNPEFTNTPNWATPRSEFIQLIDVWGSGPDNVFAVGYGGVILHYDGSVWSEMTVSTRDLLDVWGTGSDNVYAVGYEWDDLDTLGVLHYDGYVWRTVFSDTNSSPVSLWGSGPDDLFVVGDRGVVVHYDGQDWTFMDSGTPWHLVDVWGSGPNDVFAVSPEEGTIVHYNGVDWQTVHGGTLHHFYAVWGSGHNDVYVVGDSVIMRYDGSAWNEMSAVNGFWRDVWGSGADDLFVVGRSGKISHYDGFAWSEMDSGTSKTLYSVWGSGPTDVFVAADQGTLLHYDGSEWSSMNSPTTKRLYGLWGSGSDDVFVVGDGGTILHYAGPLCRVELTVEGRGYVDSVPSKAIYYEGEAITITAVADQQWFFVGWRGDLVSGDNPLPVTLGSSLTLDALFAPGKKGTIDPVIGGTLTYTNAPDVDLTIVVPGGAVTETTTLALTPLDDAGLPPELFPAGLAFDLNALWDGQVQAGFPFSQPVTVTFTYSDHIVHDLDEVELTLVVWDEGTGAWMDAAETCAPPSVYVRDLVGNILSVPICHLSRFALVKPGYPSYFPMVMKED